MCHPFFGWADDVFDFENANENTWKVDAVDTCVGGIEDTDPLEIPLDIWKKRRNMYENTII